MARNETPLTYTPPRHFHRNSVTTPFWRATALFTQTATRKTVLRIKDFPNGDENLKKVDEWHAKQYDEAAEFNSMHENVGQEVKLHINCFKCWE